MEKHYEAEVGPVGALPVDRHFHGITSDGFDAIEADVLSRQALAFDEDGHWGILPRKQRGLLNPVAALSWKDDVGCVWVQVELEASADDVLGNLGQIPLRFVADDMLDLMPAVEAATPTAGARLREVQAVFGEVTFVTEGLEYFKRVIPRLVSLVVPQMMHFKRHFVAGVVYAAAAITRKDPLAHGQPTWVTELFAIAHC